MVDLVEFHEEPQKRDAPAADTPLPHDKHQANQAAQEHANILTPTDRAQPVSVTTHDGTTIPMTRTKADDGKTTLYSHQGESGEQYFRQEGNKLVQTDRSGSAVANGETLPVKQIGPRDQFSDRPPASREGAAGPAREMQSPSREGASQPREASREGASPPRDGSSPRDGYSHTRDINSSSRDTAASQPKGDLKNNPHYDQQTGRASENSSLRQQRPGDAADHSGSWAHSAGNERHSELTANHSKDQASTKGQSGDSQSVAGKREHAEQQGTSDKRYPAGSATPDSTSRSNIPSPFGAHEAVHDQSHGQGDGNKERLSHEAGRLPADQVRYAADNSHSGKWSGSGSNVSKLTSADNGQVASRTGMPGNHDANPHRNNPDSPRGQQQEYPHHDDLSAGRNPHIKPSDQLDHWQSGRLTQPGDRLDLSKVNEQPHTKPGNRPEVLDQIPSRDHPHPADKPHSDRAIIPIPLPVVQGESAAIGGGGGGGKGIPARGERSGKPGEDSSSGRGGKQAESEPGRKPERGDKAVDHGDKGAKPFDGKNSGKPLTSEGANQPNQPGSRSDQTGGRSDKPGNRADKPGDPSDKPGDRSGRGPSDNTSGTGGAGGVAPGEKLAVRGDRVPVPAGGKGDGVGGGSGGRGELPVKFGPEGKPDRLVDSRLLSLLGDPKLQSKMLDALQTVAADRDGIRNPRVRALFEGLSDRQIWQMQFGLLDGVKNPLAFDHIAPNLQGKLIALAEILGGKELAVGKAVEAAKAPNGKLTPGSDTVTTVIRGIDLTARIFEHGNRSSDEIMSDLLHRTLDRKGTNKTFTLIQDQTSTIIINKVQKSVATLRAEQTADTNASFDQDQTIDGVLAAHGVIDQSSKISEEDEWLDEADTSDWTGSRAEKYATDILSKQQEKSKQQLVDSKSNTDSGVEQLSPIQIAGLTPLEVAALAERKLRDEQTRRERQEEELRLEIERQDQARKAQRGSYRVRFGDSVIGICRAKYRDASLAPLVYQLNLTDVPAVTYGGKLIAALKIDQVLTMPSENDIANYKKQPPLELKVDLSFPAGGMGPGNNQLGFATPEIELASRFGLSMNMPTTKRQAKSIFGQGNAKGSRTDAVKKKVRENRHNIEAALGPLREKPQPKVENRIKYVCRIGDNLRSIAQRHPALRDPELWQLLALINKLSTDVNSKNEPVEKVKRGQMLYLPTPDEIQEWRTPPQVKFVVFDDAYIELNTQECGFCERPTFVSAAICPSCNTSFANRPQSGSRQYKPGSRQKQPWDTTVETRDQGTVVKPPDSRTIHEEEDYTSTRQMKGKSSPAEPHTGTAKVTGADGKSEPKPAAPVHAPNIDGKPIPTDAQVKYLCAYARIVEEGRSDDPSFGYSISLDGYTENGWCRMVTYEFSGSNSQHHVYDVKQKARSQRLALPIKQALELAQNDLAANWQHYYMRYSIQK